MKYSKILGCIGLISFTLIGNQTTKQGGDYFPISKNAPIYSQCSLEKPIRVVLGICASPETQWQIGRKLGITHNNFPLLQILLNACSPESLTWKISCENGLRVVDASHKIMSDGETILTISHQSDQYLMNGKKLEKNQLFICPKKGLVTVNGTEYSGIFSCEQTADTFYLINHLSMEDYVAGVLPFEGVPTWPDESLKAQCVAARTYAAFKIAERRSLGKQWQFPFDIVPTTLDQTYKGHSCPINLQRILEATKGLILVHQDKPILAMYSTVCGGVIPRDKKSPVLDAHPILKRPYACNYCREQKLYRWECSVPLSELEEPLRKTFPHVQPIKSITVENYDGAGLAQIIRIIDNENTVHLMPADDFRRLANKQIKNTCFEITPDPHFLKLKGKGWGHHIGMCQWGAYAMDKLGFTFSSILSFYYPGTVITRLQDAHLF